MIRRQPVLGLVGAAALCAILGAPGVGRAEDAASQRQRVGGTRIPFVANAGQLDPAVAYSASTFVGTVFVTTDGRIVYALPAVREAETERGAPPTPGWSLTETPSGGASLRPSGEQPSPAHVSAFHGSDPGCWRTDLPTFESVSLGEPWPGITLDLLAHGRDVEKLFTVSPGADASAIAMRVAGALSLRVDESGSLIAATGIGEVAFTRPRAYQEKDGERVPVVVEYCASADAYGFSVGGHDPDLPVMIDPILQSTYIGGTALENLYALGVNPSSGDVYVAGQTQSTDFPGTAGGVQPNFVGLSDAFVARFNNALTTLIQATYLGGDGIDIAYGLLVDDTMAPPFDVLVTGQTSSVNLPGTAGGAQPAIAGGIDAFVTRFDSTLTALRQSTYYGGATGSDFGFSIDRNLAGQIVIGGQSNSTDLPGTPGGAQSTNGGGNDAFVALLSNDLTTLVQATYLGGTLVDFANGVRVDGETGNVFATGVTDSTDFPGTAAGAQPTPGGSNDAWVAHLSSDLTTLLGATYLGGSGPEYGHSIATDGGGNIYVVGQTGSANFPGTAGGAQSTFGGQQDAFVAKLSFDLATLIQTTYLGGGAAENGYAIGILFGPANEIYVAGDTASPNMPGTAGAAQPALNGGTDAFVARLNAMLTTLDRTTYLGGSQFELGAFQLDFDYPTTGVYYAGGTTSTNFPLSAGGAQPALAGGQDGFVSKITVDLGGPAALSLSKSAPGTVAPSTNLTYTITYGDPGGNDAANVVITDTVPAGTTFVSATGGGVFNAGVVTWDIGTVPAGSAGLTVSFTVLVNVGSGTVDNVTYQITATNATTVNGAPVSTTVTAPGLTIQKSAPATVLAGSNLTYTLRYGNTAAVDATGVTITDTLPAGTTFVSASNGGAFNAGSVTWNIGTVPAGSSGLTVTLTVNVAVVGDTVDNTTYSIIAPGIPAVAGAPVSTRIVSLNVNKIADPAVPPGANLTYTILYGNSGSISVGNVVISDPVPAGTTFVSATGGGTLNGGVVTWTFQAVPGGTTGQSVSFTVSVTAASGSIVNSGYTIAGTGVTAIVGRTVTTSICGPPTANASASQTSICPGSSTTLHGSGGTSCHWTPSTGLSNPNVCSPTASPAATTTYSLTVSSVCGTSNNAARVTIVLSDRPEGPQVSAPSTAIAGQFDLVASIVDPNPASLYAFAFDPPDAATITSQSDSSIVFTANVAGPLTLSVTEGNGACVSAPSALPIVVSECVSPPQMPLEASIQAAGNPAGPVTGIDFLNLSWTAPDPPPAFYVWAINGGDPHKASGTTVLNVPPTGTSDAITLQVQSACSDTAASDVADTTQTPSPPEVAQFTFTTPAIPGAPVTFTDATLNATSWLWLFGDGSTPGTTQSIDHVYDAPGTYVVYLFASNGAGETSTSQMIEVDAAASSPGARVALQRTPFDATDPRRQRLAGVQLAGGGPHRLSVLSASPSRETIAFLRFLDSAGNVVQTRRLSIAPGQNATFDLDAYGLRGTFDLEL
ncbi:MAG TPA: PKD domain-containing protein, partial [Thermoanaerobaculia bacterium]